MFAVVAPSAEAYDTAREAVRDIREDLEAEKLK
jgi:hypothetical protein